MRRGIMDYAVASAEAAAKAVLVAKKTGDYSKAALSECYNRFLQESCVMKTLALYKKAPDFMKSSGTPVFDYAGCLECGTCRILAYRIVVEKWSYPEGSMGVEFRYG